MLLKANAIILGLALVMGCGGDLPNDHSPLPQREVAQPMLRTVAPSAIRAGDTLTILGQDFADPSMGETRLTLEGEFLTTSGKSTQVNLEITPQFENQGMLTWTFGPNIPFSVDEETEDTGIFRGIIKAINVGKDGQVKFAAQAMGVELQVLPSIIIRQLRPQESGCSTGVTETIDDTPMMIELTTVGLKEGTEVAPLRYIYTFMKENFQFSGYLSNELTMDPESLFPAEGPVQVVDDVTDGATSTLGSGMPRDVYVYQNANTSNLATMVHGLDNLLPLTALSTTALPAASDYTDTMITVVAIDSAGQEASRQIPLRIWTPVEVSYDGNSRVARSYDPVPVSGCIPGGDIGRDVTYAEATEELRLRSFTVKNNQGVEGSVGFDVKLAKFSTKLFTEFGFEVSAAVSSKEEKDLAITGFILPRQFAVFYRQTLQLERVAKLVSHGPCGNTRSMGTVVVTDWVWSPDLAKGTSCPPLPPSNLPDGEIFE